MKLLSEKHTQMNSYRAVAPAAAPELQSGVENSLRKNVDISIRITLLEQIASKLRVRPDTDISAELYRHNSTFQFAQRKKVFTEDELEDLGRFFLHGERIDIVKEFGRLAARVLITEGTSLVNLCSEVVVWLDLYAPEATNKFLAIYEKICGVGSISLLEVADEEAPILLNAADIIEVADSKKVTPIRKRVA